MKYITLLITLLVTALSVYSQTVENIRVVQDGDNLKITYRIGASSDAQLYNVFLSCTMDGGKRFDPTAVIGDVGENIIGGKSFYTIIWDVFEDVEEVVNPEFFIKVDLISDMSVAAVPAATRSQEIAKQEPEEQQTVQEAPKQASTSEPGFKNEKTKAGPNFDRNGFFSFSFATGMGIPFGISFGSLNNWGYYVTPLRIGIDTYDLSYYDYYWSQYVTEREIDIHYMLAAGVTKHFVSAGFYRLHGYWGLGSHIYGSDLAGVLYDPAVSGHVMLETGIINVLGKFNITAGLSYSIGLYYNPTSFVFGAGFVF